MKNTVSLGKKSMISWVAGAMFILAGWVRQIAGLGRLVPECMLCGFAWLALESATWVLMPMGSYSPRVFAQRVGSR